MSDDPTTYGGVAVRGLTIEKLARKAFQNTFDVKRWGAKGDGTTDDTAAIQAAIDAAEVNGGRVWMPAGDYAFTNLVIDNNDVSLCGEGRTATTLKCQLDDGSTSAIRVVGQACELTGFEIEAVATNTTAIGIEVGFSVTTAYTHYGTYIGDVGVIDFDSYGMYLVQPECADIDRCIVDGAGAAGIYINGDQWSAIRGINCIVRNTRVLDSDVSIHINDMNTVTLLNVEALDTTDSVNNRHIYIQDSYACLVAGCDIERPSSAIGLEITGSLSTVLGGFFGTLNYGIKATSNTVDGEHVIIRPRFSSVTTPIWVAGSGSGATLIGVEPDSIGSGSQVHCASGQFGLAVDTPTALSAGNNNDYDPGHATVLRLTANSAGSTITGIQGGFEGRQLCIINVSSYVLTLAHQSGSSTAAYRIISPTADNLRLGLNESLWLYYDATTARWRVLVPKRYERVTTPSALAAGNNNDWTPGTGTFLRVTGNATTSYITGIAGGASGRTLSIVNVGSDDFIVSPQDGLSTAANRIISPTGADITLSTDESISMVYDATTARWRITNIQLA